MGWFSKLLRRSINGPSTATALVRRGAAIDGRDIVPGTLLGDTYRVEAVLGEGAFGRVLRCVNGRGQPCAIKTLRSEVLVDPSMRRLMRDEVQRWVELGIHPHIVSAFGLLEHARLPCLVMEFLDGFEDLSRRIARGAGGWRLAARVGAQIAAALEHGQRRSGLVHRDIKPANILVGAADHAKLGDFGISVARLVETDALAGSLLGTVPYMAPELWLAEPRHSVQSDLYALGVALFETCVPGHPLIERGGLARADYARLHANAPPRSPLADDPSIPMPLAAFILQCLEKEPSRRPADAGAACARLVDICRVHAGGSPLRGAEGTPFDEARTWVNRSSLFHQLDMADVAIEYARNALELAPDNAEAMHAMGNACELAGRTDEAIRWLERAAALAGAHDVAALGSLAFALARAGHRDAARAALERALHRCERGGGFARLDPISHLVVDLLEPAAALSACDRILAAQPEAAITWNNRSVLRRRLRQPAEALADADRALAINPLYAKALVSRANACIDLQRFTAARDAAASAIGLDPALAGAYAAHFAACLATGDATTAEATLREGLAELPQHPLLTRNLEQLAAWRRDHGQT